jgi:hypothetical protein
MAGMEKNKMIELNANVSMITLNVNGLSTSIKAQVSRMLSKPLLVCKAQPLRRLRQERQLSGMGSG